MSALSIYGTLEGLEDIADFCCGNDFAAQWQVAALSTCERNMF